MGKNRKRKHFCNATVMLDLKEMYNIFLQQKLLIRKSKVASKCKHENIFKLINHKVDYYLIFITLMLTYAT